MEEISIYNERKLSVVLADVWKFRGNEWASSSGHRAQLKAKKKLETGTALFISGLGEPYIRGWSLVQDDPLVSA